MTCEMQKKPADQLYHEATNVYQAGTAFPVSRVTEVTFLLGLVHQE